MGPADLSHQANQKPIPMVTFTQLRWPPCPRQPRLQWDYAGVVGGGVYQDSALLSQTLTSLSVVGGVKGGHFPRPDRKPAQHRRRFPLSPWYWGPLFPCWSSQASLDLLSVPHSLHPFFKFKSCRTNISLVSCAFRISPSPTLKDGWTGVRRSVHRCFISGRLLTTE